MAVQKSVLITGCTDGTAGASLAKQFQLRGFHVFATARNLEKMKGLKEIGISLIQLDVVSQEAIDAAVRTVQASSPGGKLDMLVNNAAMFNIMPAVDTQLDDARAMFEVNFFGPLALTQAFLPLLLEAGEGAAVVNINSVSTVANPPLQGVYAATKAALLSLSEVMRLELAPLGLRVVTVFPGALDTRFDQGPSWKVPEKSHYAALAGEIEDKSIMGKTARTTPDDFAKDVVNSLLRSRGPKLHIWSGEASTMVWVLTWFGWTGMTDGTWKKMFKLNTIGSPK